MPAQDVLPTVRDFPSKPGATVTQTRNGYELLFDSFAQPAIDGARTSVVSARQLLFRIGTVFVDVEVGTEVESARASLVGQMLDSSNPSHPPVGILIVLLDRGRRIATTSSDAQGEFQLQFAMKSNLKLSVALDPQKPVYLPIARPGRRARVVPRHQEQVH
jgi:hypothetical protein